MVDFIEVSFDDGSKATLQVDEIKGIIPSALQPDGIPRTELRYENKKMLIAEVYEHFIERLNGSCSHLELIAALDRIALALTKDKEK